MLKKILILSGFFLLIGCDNDSSKSGGDSKELPNDVTSALSASKSTLSQDLKDSITYMYSEEGLAYDVYTNIYKIQAVNQLTNIANNAEIKHQDAVNKLAIKYDLNITKWPDTTKPYSTDDLKRYGNGLYPVDPIQDLYNYLYDEGIQSKQKALEVGCMVEVVDVEDLLKYMKFAKASNATDVEEVFDFLLKGSYNHYWAFDKGLKNIGVEKGCCAVNDYAGINFCHPEYPNEEKGQEKDGGKGKGKK